MSASSVVTATAPFSEGDPRQLGSGEKPPPHAHHHLQTPRGRRLPPPAPRTERHPCPVHRSFRMEPVKPSQRRPSQRCPESVPPHPGPSGSRKGHTGEVLWLSPRTSDCRLLRRSAAGGRDRVGGDSPGRQRPCHSSTPHRSPARRPSSPRVDSCQTTQALLRTQKRSRNSMGFS